MPDISKCSGADCPLKECCYRYTSKSSPFWQAWTEELYKPETKECVLFWCAEGKEDDYKKIVQCLNIYDKVKEANTPDPPLEESDINPIS
jgi:hypothetical protein